MENIAFAEPAFSETIPSRESSNDIAGIELSSNGTVVKNTMSALWKKGALISFKIDNVPSPKCVLAFEIVGISKGDSAVISVTRNDDPVSKIQISSEGAKKFETVLGVETAVVNRAVSVPLDRGDQNVVFQILSDTDAALSVANFKVYGMGSNKGFGSVRVYAAAEKDGTSRYLWFKRAGTDTANFSKYKLYERELPDVRPSDFALDIEGGAGKDFKVTWWDTRENKEIASGVVKCGADSKLKLRTPPFKLDVACAVEEAK